MRSIIHKNCNFVRKILLFWFLGIIVLSASLFADELPKVLILNSNTSIQKYSQVAEEFKITTSDFALIEELDIGSKWIDEEIIEEKIYDTSPNLILCIGSKAYLMAKKFTKNTPLLFTLGIHRRRFDLTEKTYVIESELPPVNQLTMFRFFFPKVTKIGVLYSSKYNQKWINDATSNAHEVGIQLVGIPIENKESLGKALEASLPEIDALWLISDPIALASRQQVNTIFQQSHASQKPVFAYDRIFGSFGATLIVSADIITIAKQASQVALNLLEDKKILQKIQKPAGSYIAIQLEKIEQYQIQLNSRALSFVNEYFNNSK